MFWEAFRVTGGAVLQIFFLSAIGYFLKKREILNEAGLDVLSRLTIGATLPFLIFGQLLRDFNFSLYPQWWAFPLLSVAVTALGLAVGIIFSGFIRGRQNKLQFLNLVAFQNSGFLPLAMIIAMLPSYKSSVMLIYLFLFLIGFNLIIWPLAGYILSFSRSAKFEFRNLFNPPAVAAILGVAAVSFGLNRFIPELVLKPVRMVGDCTLPLAMFVVGAELAKIRINHFDKKAMFFLALAKLVVLPAIGLGLILKLELPELVGLLILIELAVPPATSLSVIARNYKKEDLLISQGIFLGHLLSLVTMPVFLSLYFSRVVIK